MIKYLILLFSGILLGQNTLSDYSLHGNVRALQSVTSISKNEMQTAVSGFLDSEKFDSVYLKFDQKGNLVLKENYLDYRGKLGLFDRTIFQFNLNNQIEKLETTLIQNGEEPRKISQQKLFYYIQNQLVRIDVFNSGRISDQFWVMNYIYDGGRLTRKDFWMEDAIFSNSKFEYRLMKVISEKTFHNDGRLGKTTTFKYDNNAKLILKSTESGNEKTEETFDYEKQNTILHKVKNNDKVLLAEYRSQNNLPREIQKFNYITQKFDVYEFKFEYDSQNNWINCLILKNQLPEFTIKRKIYYY